MGDGKLRKLAGHQEPSRAIIYWHSGTVMSHVLLIGGILLMGTSQCGKAANEYIQAHWYSHPIQANRC